MGPRVAAIPVGIGLGAAFLYSNFLIDWVLRGFTGLDRVVSRLEAPGEAHATILRVTDVACAVLVLALTPALRAALPSGRATIVLQASLVVFALGAAAAAFVPLPCPTDDPCAGSSVGEAATVHDAASVASEIAIFVGVATVWWSTRSTGPAWIARSAGWIFWVVGVGTTAAFAGLGLLTDDETLTAYAQRVHVVGVSVWLACLGLIAASAVSTREGALR